MLDACHFPRRKLNICSIMHQLNRTSLIEMNVAHIIHVFSVSGSMVAAYSSLIASLYMTRIFPKTTELKVEG